MANTNEEPADAYGRHEGCFLDYKKAPFRFEDVLRNLEPIRLVPSRNSSGGLIPEPGLQVGTFPEPSVGLDEPFETTGHEYSFDFTKEIGDSLTPLVPRTSLLRDLQLPLELPDLRSNPIADLADYLKIVGEKRLGNPLAQWLPISPTIDEEDEGLHFPAKAARLHSLLLRELACESIEVPQEVMSSEQELKDPMPAKAPSTYEKLKSRAKLTEADTITPPLSPMSEHSHESPYEPNAEVCTIDLTSEPSSPVAPEILRLEQSIEDGTIESIPAICEMAPGLTAASPNLPTYTAKATTGSLRDLSLDVPLASTDPSTTTPNEYLLKNTGLLNTIAGSDPLSEPGPIESFFDDAFASILEAHRSNATMLAEQEQFDPIDSVSRISVPALDFTIDRPAWVGSTYGTKEQFAWIQKQQTGYENLSPVPRSAVSENNLKWAPFAPSVGRMSTNEVPEPLSDKEKGLLIPEAEPELGSGSYITRTMGLAVERLGDEEELAAGEEDPESPVKAPYHSSGFFEPRDELIMQKPSDDGLESLVLAAASKRRRAQTSEVIPRVLLGSSDSDATSKLLMGFMEMRAVKKPRTAPSAKSIATPGIRLPPTPLSKSPEKEPAALPASTSSHEPGILTPAPAPSFTIPGEKGCFVISLSLGRSLLRYIERSWPQDYLIDRDYSRHNNLVWSPGSTQRKEVLSPLSYDADISLSPTIGVIVASLLKAKQKPLPKSNTLPQLRDRVLKVSQKFETLFVLVSECNASGEYTSKPHPSDAAAYSDFVRFTIGLQAGVSTFFVPGADHTMAKWILSLICKYTPNALGSKPYLNTVESTWEVFFRRAGMNAFAAQVLAGAVLEKGGNEGLARLMASSPQEIMGTFGQVLGGKKALANLSQLLCTPWGQN